MKTYSKGARSSTSCELAREWIRKAEEDYQAALFLSRKTKPALLNSICFHSQQAAEKYFKAYLAMRKIRFPKTHDLILLKNLCAKEKGDFELISDLVLSLNPYSVEFRYPGEEATRQDAKHAISVAKEIRGFFLEKLKFS